MILQLRVLAAAVAIAAAFAVSNCAGAIDIRVDFNDALAAPTNWNLVSSPSVGSSVADLIDFSTGASTGISAVIHDNFGDSSATETVWNAPPAYRPWIDVQANQDYFFVRATLGGEVDNPTGGVTFSGLDPTKTYRVELVGSRDYSSSSSRYFHAIANGMFSDDSNSDSFNAKTQGYDGHQVMTWRQVTAPDGELVVSLDTDTGQHGYINALRLTEAPPQTVLIDFGDDSLTTPGRWNNITLTTTGGLMALGHKLIGAVDAAGQETNVRVNFLSGFNGGANTAGLPSDAAGFAITAQRDSILIENKVPPAVVQIEGLKPGAAYDVTLFGSRAEHLEPERGARFTIGGVSQDLLNTDNESNAARFDNVVADQHGHIQIDVGVYVGQWAYLGALEINGQFRPKVHRPSLFFDFGSPSYQTPGHWNNITTTDAGLKISDAVDSIGESTGVSLTFANAFNSIGAGSTEATGGSWSDDAGFPISAQRDAFLVDGTVRQMQLDGLIPGAEYEVRLFGSRHDRSHARTTDFRVGTAAGGWSDWITLDTAFNTENVVQFITRPDALGELLVEARRASGGAWGYLGVMQITQIPEPGSAALLLAGMFCLMLRRRRRRRGG
jgi:hypothetical protein